MTTKYKERHRSEITIHLGQMGRIKLCCWMKCQWVWFEKGLKVWSGVLWTASHEDGSYVDAVLTYYKGKALVGPQAMRLSLVPWLCHLTPGQCSTVRTGLPAGWNTSKLNNWISLAVSTQTIGLQSFWCDTHTASMGFPSICIPKKFQDRWQLSWET